MIKLLYLTLFSLLFLKLCFGHSEKEGFDRWINVTGHGEVSAPPDMAVLRLGVLSTAKTAKLSTELNNQAILRIFEVLEELNIEDDDYETGASSLLRNGSTEKGCPL